MRPCHHLFCHGHSGAGGWPTREFFSPTAVDQRLQLRRVSLSAEGRFVGNRWRFGPPGALHALLGCL